MPAGTVRANFEDVVMISVVGQITAPGRGASPYTVSYAGEPQVLPGTGGIVYNVRVGDRAIGWASDHMEPGVTIKNKDAQENGGLNVLACIGNDAYVVAGEARGARGTVTGKHGGAEHVMVDFTPDVLERLVIGDRIQVRAYGRGLRLTDAPEVKLLNMSVQLLRVLPLDVRDGVVEIPVAGIVPLSWWAPASAIRPNGATTTSRPTTARCWPSTAWPGCAWATWWRSVTRTTPSAVATARAAG
jgi:hypothetical protein